VVVVAAPIEDRVALARRLLSAGTLPEDYGAVPDPTVLVARLAHPALKLEFPAGLAPVPRPPAAGVGPDDPLPKADAVVLTWTADETDALAAVMTPGYGRSRWTRYGHGFDGYLPHIRQGAPSRLAGRLGSYLVADVGSLTVLCMKSELHLAQDAVSTGAGTATLPVKDLFKQVIAEAQPAYFFSIGTAGSTFAPLGAAVVSRAAKFRLAADFKNEPFNGALYKSDWPLPTSKMDVARGLIAQFAPAIAEPPVGPPTTTYAWDGTLIAPPASRPQILLDGADFDAFHPILTTDYFEYGTSANHLDAEGCAVEMDDAALGLACSELPDPPRWAAVRNMSDPVINAALPATGYPIDVQTLWAVAYYTSYGYFTSVIGALATWGLLAGL
jgi:hypothetical protein